MGVSILVRDIQVLVQDHSLLFRLVLQSVGRVWSLELPVEAAPLQTRERMRRYTA